MVVVCGEAFGDEKKVLKTTFEVSKFVVACGHFSSLSRLWSTGQESPYVYTVCGVKGTPKLRLT